jgi:quinohemoprotein ethanol dehydrogenase
VTAYDQKTGKQAWRFHTVPGDPARGFENKAMEMAAQTWTGEWWKHGGGGTAWNAFAYDPVFNRIYIGTGNGAPWNARIRSPGGGDNLFVCSIIALDADTGEYVWHYQTNPGETWDFNSAMDIILADLPLNGGKRPVILHAPKNGFFYVIDRATGKLISAEPIVPVSWAERIDLASGRPVENPEARFPGGRAAIVYPSPFGAHNIEAMSFNPATGLAYVPAMDQGRAYVDPPSLSGFRFLSGQRISNGIGTPPADLAPRPPSSMLIAWDPVRQQEAWRVPMRGPRGGGATLSTAGGLVFQGRGAGQFTALDGRTGKLLWSFDAQTAVMAQPISYSIGGRQYVTVIAGSRYPTAQGFDREWDYRTQQWRVLTFALDARNSLPSATQEPQPFPDDAAFTVEPARVEPGRAIYAERCAICHGAGALPGGAAPDLLRSPIPLDHDAFRTVLHDGVMVDRGMPRFAELSADEIRNLQAYLRQRAREARAAAAGRAQLKRERDEGQ